jgi:polyisoprenoid-binding protein YceI
LRVERKESYGSQSIEDKLIRIFACLATLFSALLFGSPVIAKTSVWKIDSAKSTVSFVVLRGARIGAQGIFRNVQGNITFDSNDITLSKVFASIPIETIDTGIGARDSDLIGAKYFNSGAFPIATFASQKVRLGTNGKYFVTGLFKLHGFQKTIDLLLTKPTITSSKKGLKLFAASAKTAIDQTDYGLSLRLLHPDGFVRINNEIAIKVSIEASSSASRK